MPSISTQLWSLVEKTDSCWIWKGSKSPSGYGKVAFLGATFRASRFVWEFLNGSIPEGNIVCHRCDNPECVNPDHLWIGTTQDNVDDKVLKGRQAKGSRMHERRVTARGESHGTSKLTEAQVLEIRRLYKPGHKRGEHAPGTIAKRYGVDRTLIHSIVKRRIWSHI